MEFYEVIIIGAGPGGLSAAQKLSEAGKKVLLLEKNNEIGPKVCAGGLTGKAMKKFNLPKELFDHRFEEIFLHSPFFSSEIKLKEPFTYTVDRKNLGQWMLKRLEKTGADIGLNARATKIASDHIIVNDSEKINFKYLIGADGANSIVRKFVGLKNEKLLIAIQYIVPGDAYKKFELFFDSRLFSAGYAWIFPHKGYASIGCGCEPNFFSSKDLMAGFKEWLVKEKIDVSKSRYESFLINYNYLGYKFGNIFLVGDAAGLSSGLTGGGIYQAMISGEEAAKSIIDEKYVSRDMEEVIKSNEKQNHILDFALKSGSFLGLEIELLVLLTKNNYFCKYLGRAMF